MEQGDIYNNQKIYLAKSNFSNLAEKDIILSSQILKKNEIELENKLKEEENIFAEMKKQQEKWKKAQYPNNSQGNQYNQYNQYNQLNQLNQLNQSNQSNQSNNSTNSSLNSNNQISFNSQLNMPGMSNNIINDSYRISLSPSQLNYLSQVPIDKSQHFVLNNQINNNNNIQGIQGIQGKSINSLGRAYSQINIGIKNPTIGISNNIPTNIKNHLSSKGINYINSSFIPTPLNLQIKQEQEKKDKLIKTEIIERHGVKYTNYFEYPKEQKEKYIDELLKDMNLFGNITKKEIEKEKKLNPTKYLSIEDAMRLGDNNNMYKNDYFVLAVLSQALEFQGCSVAIEKNYPQNKEDNKEINSTIQFLANGMYNFKKYILYFNFGEQNNKILFRDILKQNHFNLKLKKKLQEVLNLQDNDIIICNRRFEPYSVTAIIKKSEFNEYSKENLLQILKKDPQFINIQYIEKNILLSGCKLNPYILDCRGNNKDGGWGNNEIRGGLPYYPPNGWVGYGLRIADRFDNGDNSWIDYNHSKGEWSVAYHGIKSGLIGNQIFNSKNSIMMSSILIAGMKYQFKDFKDAYHLGQKVGEGVIITPKPQIMEQNCGSFNCCGKKYKIGFMTRVMPKKIRCPEGQDNYWVINGTDNEIRPYRILIKEVLN